MFLSFFLHTHTHTEKHTHAQTYTHTHTSAHTYTDTQICNFFLHYYCVLSIRQTVARSFRPIREGLRRSRPPRVSQLVSTRHHWADIFIVRRQGPDGRKGSLNSTATCSTWRGMGSARLYFAQDSPCDDNIQPYHTGSIAEKTGCKVICGAPTTLAIKGLMMMMMMMMMMMIMMMY